MKRHKITDLDVIHHSQDLFHTFNSRDIINFSNYLDDDFVWIGDYLFQYVKGKYEYLQLISDQINLPRFKIQNEEYTILIHEKNVWVVYGRCSLSIDSEKHPPINTVIHFSLVWKKENNNLRLLLCNCNNAKNISLNALTTHNIDAIIKQKENSSRFSDIASLYLSHKKTQDKISIKDITGSIHFLSPIDILYIQSEAKNCIIHTINNQTITSCRSLKSIELPSFIRVHSRYLVNKMYIISIKRHEITMVNNTIIPVGKQRYNSVLELLQTT